MNVIYNKYTGDIDKVISDNQDYLVYYKLFPQEFKDALSSLYIEFPPKDLKNYRIVNNELVIKTDDEINEIKEYGKILSDKERYDIVDAEKQAEQKKIESESIQSFAKMSFKMTAPSLTPTQILQFEPLVEDWIPSTYIIGDIRKHLGQIWKCVQGHNNTNNPDIAPGKSPAQWVAYKSKDIKYAKPYIQPQGAHDAYMKGEYCIFADKTYKSKIDNNVWTPMGYPTGWEVTK